MKETIATILAMIGIVISAIAGFIVVVLAICIQGIIPICIGVLTYYLIKGCA